MNAASANRVIVLGGSNLDYQGRPFRPYLEGDSNPGSISRLPGGVGRNIAENLARLGMDVSLITAVGDDSDGRWLLEDCGRKGIRCEESLILSDSQTGRYLCILDTDGSLAGAVADMAAAERMTPEFLLTKRRLLDRADFIVADANLPEASLLWLASVYGRDREGGSPSKPALVLDPVSATKALRARGLIGECACAKPNLAEARALAGLGEPREGDAGRGSGLAEAAVEGLAAAGRMPRRLFVSLGGAGMLYRDESGASGRLPLPSPERRPPVVSRSGGGDAACAALVWSMWKGYPPEGQAKAALAASLLCAASELPVYPGMGEAALEAAMARFF